MGIQKKLKNIPISVATLIIIGSLVWSATMVKSGLVRDYGVAFWGPNGHDGVWHLALSNSLARGTFENPVFAGEPLQNYHLGFDLLLASLTKLTGIDASVWYFQILPPLMALLIGLLTYQFVLKWTKFGSRALWSVFFVYFGGSIGPIIHLIRYRRLGGDSMFWAQSAATTLINPPFALSLVIFLAGLLCIQSYIKNKRKKYLIISTLLFGILVQIKAYAGFLALAALFVTAVWRYTKEREIDLVLLFLGSLVLSLCLFLPFNRLSSSLVVFYPFWFLETLMSFGERLFWERYHQAMTNYKVGGIWTKAILAYGVAFVIFIVGNLGTRIVGLTWFWQKLKRIKRVDYVSIFVGTIIIVGVVLPMIVVQKGTPWNTIQFFYYSLFFMGILSGIFLGKLLVSTTTALQCMVVVALVLLLTLPTTVTTMGHYLPKTPPAQISHGELEALRFLEDQPQGIVLTVFLESERRFLFEGVVAPRPLYLYDSTAYVSAYANKPTYFDDEVNLNIMGYDWTERKKLVKEFQNNPLTPKGKEILKEINPDYIYYLKNIGLKGLDENYLGIKNIYDNEEVIVYKVIK